MNYESMTDRELDALVAEKVFSQQLTERGTSGWPVIASGPDFPSGVPHWATSIPDAFELVEAMRERGFLIDLHQKFTGRWDVSFEDDIGGYLGECVDESLPRAICIAALRALGE